MNKQSYQEWLKDPRWIKRRNQILTRDKNTCQFCGAQDKYLHVHHREYFDGFLPWEYPDSTLVTLCEDCHKYIHSNILIEDIKVGDILGYYHSDWFMNYIIYDVNGITKHVQMLGCDDGAGVDSIFDDEESFDFVKTKCHKIVDVNGLNYLFPYWLNEIMKNYDRLPFAFRYNLERIITSNNIISDFYFNPWSYDDLLDEEAQHPIN